jgi:hypothetical protein
MATGQKLTAAFGCFLSALGLTAHHLQRFGRRVFDFRLVRDRTSTKATLWGVLELDVLSAAHTNRQKKL